MGENTNPIFRDVYQPSSLQLQASSLDRDSLGAELTGRGNEDARLDAARERETRVLLEVHVDLGGGAATLAGMDVRIC